MCNSSPYIALYRHYRIQVSQGSGSHTIIILVGGWGLLIIHIIHMRERARKARPWLILVL